MTEMETVEGKVQKESLLQPISFIEGGDIESKEGVEDVAIAKETEVGSMVDDQIGNSDLPAKKVVATKAQELNQKNIFQLPLPPRSALAFFKAHLVDESTGDLKECELAARWEEVEVGGRLKFENMADADKTRYVGEVQERFAG